MEHSQEGSGSDQSVPGPASSGSAPRGTWGIDDAPVTRRKVSRARRGGSSRSAQSGEAHADAVSRVRPGTTPRARLRATVIAGIVRRCPSRPTRAPRRGRRPGRRWEAECTANLEPMPSGLPALLSHRVVGGEPAGTRPRGRSAARMNARHSCPTRERSRRRTRHSDCQHDEPDNHGALRPIRDERSPGGVATITAPGAVGADEDSSFELPSYVSVRTGVNGTLAEEQHRVREDRAMLLTTMRRRLGRWGTRTRGSAGERKCSPWGGLFLVRFPPSDPRASERACRLGP